MGELTLSEMQAEHREWIERNFPKQTIEQVVFGMIEELGELAHAHLKYKQGIRGIVDEQHLRELFIDAHCDLIIFSLSLADMMNYDLEEQLQLTWLRVKQRDWVANPETGDAISDL